MGAFASLENTFTLVRLQNNQVLSQEPVPKPKGSRGAPRKHGADFQLTAIEREPDAKEEFCRGKQKVRVRLWHKLHFKRIANVIGFWLFGRYESLTQRLREIVSDLRPPMLNYGLEPAIREFAYNLMERGNDNIQVEVGLQTDGSRYSQKTELHLFRIVQEACENALRHSQTKTIKISGELNEKEINLNLEDNGIGFDTEETLNLSSLIVNKHFGLAGMIERGVLIGAEISIDSRQTEGTLIEIKWINK